MTVTCVDELALLLCHRHCWPWVEILHLVVCAYDQMNLHCVHSSHVFCNLIGASGGPKGHAKCCTSILILCMEGLAWRTTSPMDYAVCKAWTLSSMQMAKNT